MQPSISFGDTNSGFQIGINHGPIEAQFHIQNITTIRPLAHSIYKSLFNASDLFGQVRNELGLLISVLNVTEEHTPKFRPDDPQILELNDALTGCRMVLQDLQRLKEHFDNVGPQTQVTWERMGWGVEELADIRGKFSLQIQVLNLLNTTMLRSSHENVERMLKTFISEILSGKRESAAMSSASTGSLTVDEKEAWRSLRKELQSIGITPDLFTQHRHFILNTLQTLLTEDEIEDCPVHLVAANLNRREGTPERQNAQLPQTLALDPHHHAREEAQLTIRQTKSSLGTNVPRGMQDQAKTVEFNPRGDETTITVEVVKAADNEDSSQEVMALLLDQQGDEITITEKTLKQKQSTPGEPTPQEFVKLIDTYVKEKPMLNTFFKDNQQFIQDIARKAVDLAKDTTSDLGSPEVLPKTIEVTMHQQVIYCDDSGSMVNRRGLAENRWQSQLSLARRIARITTRIIPDDEGVALRFINQQTDESPKLKLDDIGRLLDSITPRDYTAIGTTLRERILKPMVYNPLTAGTLKRPLLVSILTDGGPSKEDKGTLVNEIIQCGKELERMGRPMDAVKFLVGQIGSSYEAIEFLRDLKAARDNSTALASVLYIFAGRFDDEFNSFRDERKLDRWLIETLFKPLATGESI